MSDLENSFNAAYSKALVQTLRPQMLLLGAGWRAAFSPLDYGNVPAQESVLDLAVQGPFDTNNLPEGWFDCGWIKEFKTTVPSKIGDVESGYRGAIRARYRGEIGLQLDFKFREAGRLQMKIASGGSVFNLLDNPVSSEEGPLSTEGNTAVPLSFSGYVTSGTVPGYEGRPVLYVSSGSSSIFGPTSSPVYIVCDQDMTAEMQTMGGLVGDNGTFIFPETVNDTDFIRKTSDYVARVVAVVASIDVTVYQASGMVSMNHSAPLANWIWAVRWTDFTTPTLPDDAVIQAVYAVVDTERVTGPNPSVLARIHAGTTVLDPWAISDSGSAIKDGGAGVDWNGEFYANLSQTTISWLGTASAYMRLISSFSIPTVDDIVTARAVGFAIYYTSATPGNDSDALSPPVAIPGGQGVAWTYPQAAEARYGEPDDNGTASGMGYTLVPTGQDALVLDQPFIKGNDVFSTLDPGSPVGKVQKIIGWSAREGGTNLHPWSGLFIMDTLDGAQIAMYFPRMCIRQSRELEEWGITDLGISDITGLQLDSTFECLAFDDPIDGEVIVGYYAFYPAAQQNTY